jgi:hypothetical protein
MYLIGVHLVYLTGVHLTGVHLKGVHLIGVYLMGVHYGVVPTTRRYNLPVNIQRPPRPIASLYQQGTGETLNIANR